MANPCHKATNKTEGITVFSFTNKFSFNQSIFKTSPGKGKILVDGKTIYLSAGDLFILPKDVSIFYQADDIDPWTYLWVGFSG